MAAHTKNYFGNYFVATWHVCSLRCVISDSVYVGWTLHDLGLGDVTLLVSCVVRMIYYVCAHTEFS